MTKPRPRSRRFASALAALGILSLSSPGIAQASSWDTGVIDTAGDCGRFCQLIVDDLGDFHAVYCRTDTPTVKVVSRVGTAWGSPEVVDISNDIDGYCSIAIDGSGARRIAYRRSGTGALWYAGPEETLSWNVEAMVSPDNVGQALSLVRSPAGNLSLSCRDITNEALVFMTRDGGGTWSTPQTVDSGAGRGRYPDHAYRAGAGYVFTEYDEGSGMMLYADPVLRAQNWSATPIAAEHDIGAELSLTTSPEGVLSASCRDATDDALLLLVRGDVGDWAIEDTVDPGPDRGRYADHVYRPGIGYAFTEYDEGNGMMLYADPVLRAQSWSANPIMSEHDIGLELSLATSPAGSLSVSCRDATDGSLLLLVRDDVGGWAVENTVDPGPARGRYADHVYRPGIGYAFTEYDEGNGMMLYADPVLRAQSWSAGIAHGTFDAGRHVSVTQGPGGRLVAAFYRFDAEGLGTVCAAVKEVTWGTVIVADSVATTAGTAAYTDLVATDDCDWYVAYRKSTAPSPGAYLATTSGLCTVDVPGSDDLAAPPPTAYAVLPNSPNPFNPVTTFRFDIPEPATVVLEIFDVSGKLVWRHEDTAERDPGHHRLTWDGRDGDGRALASGVYYYRIEMGPHREANQMVMLK